MLVWAPEQTALDSFHAALLYGCAFGDLLVSGTITVLFKEMENTDKNQFHDIEN